MDPTLKITEYIDPSKAPAIPIATNRNLPENHQENFSPAAAEEAPSKCNNFTTSLSNSNKSSRKTLLLPTKHKKKKKNSKDKNKNIWNSLEAIKDGSMTHTCRVFKQRE